MLRSRRQGSTTAEAAAVCYVRTHTEACLEDKVVIALGTLRTSALHKRRHVQLGDEVTVTLRVGVRTTQEA